MQQNNVQGKKQFGFRNWTDSNNSVGETFKYKETNMWPTSFSVFLSCTSVLTRGTAESTTEM